MALKLYDTLNPSGDFPLVEAKDVSMPDGTRLSEAFGSKEEVDILPLTAYSDFVYDSTFGYVSYQPDAFTLTPGNAYKVVWDGEVFECVAQDVSSIFNIEGAVLIGDATKLGLLGNGEPFVVLLNGLGTTYFISMTDIEAGGSHTVRIYQEVDFSLAEQVKSLSGRVDGIDERVETLETPAVSVDMTAFEESGTIVENRADGYTVEHTMEFDESGVPVKLTTITKNEEGEIVKESETELVGFSSMTTPSYTAAEGVSF